MAVAGSLTYKTELDTLGVKKGINDIEKQVSSGGAKVKDIITALGITKIIQTSIEKITSSIDGAVDRFDTMNNFPKVMSNMKIGAQDSQKAIDKLADGLQGIPTALNDGALAVQRFTSKNGDVQKSVDIFLAVNDAILAGGASMPMQTSALEQLSQSYAKGKMDMMEWRTIQTAMPAQLKQVAQAMGVTTDELGEMLREGDNTSEAMDRFIETIIRLDKEGENGFQSLAKQARNSTGGIKTNIANMNTAITRGVTKVIESLNKGLKKAKLGTIGDNITKVGKTTENVLKKIASRLEKIDWQKVIKALKTIIPLILSAVAAMTTYNAVLKINEGINIAKSIISATSALLGMTSATQLSAEAMKIFNLVMSANPVGIVIASITALIALMVVFSKTADENKTKTQELNDSLEKHSETMKEAEKAKQEYISSNMTEISHVERLKTELDALTESNGKVKAGYEERANFIVSELNNALGTEIQITDGVIQNYSEIEQKVYDVINAKKAKILMEGQEKVYKESLKEEKNLYETYAEAVSNSNAKLSERDKWLKETANQYGISKTRLLELLGTHDIFNQNLEISGNSLINLQAKYTGLNNSIDQSSQTLIRAKGAYAENQATIGQYEIALQNLSVKNYEAVFKMYQDTINLQGKTKEETIKNYDAYIQAQLLYLDDLKKNKYNYDEEYLKGEKARVEKVIENLQLEKSKYTEASDLIKQNEKEKQQSIMTTTEEGQKKISKVWNQSLANRLTEITGHNVEFKKTAKGHIQAYIDGQKEGSPMSKKEAKKFAKEIESEMKKVDSKSAASNTIIGFNNEFTNRQGSTFGIIRNYGTSILNTLKRALKERSPSKATAEIATNAIKGFEVGEEREEEKAFKKIDVFGKEVLERMTDAVSIQTGKMSFSGTSGSISQILSSNATFEGNFKTIAQIDGDTLFEVNQKVSQKKQLQTGFGG